VIVPTISVVSRQRETFMDLTREVQSMVASKAWTGGAVLVYCPHTTAGLTINEGADPDVQRDLLTALRRLIPEQGDYRHAEGNSDAHLKASLMGSSVLVPLEGGKLGLGTWQAIYFCEFDGPRQRQVLVNHLPG
jgi:secondary thiamine-phosphate synthase enzyme